MSNIDSLLVPIHFNRFVFGGVTLKFGTSGAVSSTSRTFLNCSTHYRIAASPNGRLVAQCQRRES